MFFSPLLSTATATFPISRELLESARVTPVASRFFLLHFIFLVSLLFLSPCHSLSLTLLLEHVMCSSKYISASVRTPPPQQQSKERNAVAGCRLPKVVF